MKKLILILFVALSIIGFAQQEGTVITNKASVFADSLKYTASGTADSVFIIKANFRFDAARIFINGNSNSPVDSLGVQLGGIRRNNAGVPIDTSWGSYISFKDSAWNITNTLINNTVGKDFSLYTMPVFELMKISVRNHRATLVTRKVDVLVQLK